MRDIKSFQIATSTRWSSVNYINSDQSRAATVLSKLPKHLYNELLENANSACDVQYPDNETLAFTNHQHPILFKRGKTHRNACLPTTCRQPNVTYTRAPISLSGLLRAADGFEDSNVKTAEEMEVMDKMWRQATLARKL